MDEKYLNLVLVLWLAGMTIFGGYTYMRTGKPEQVTKNKKDISIIQSDISALQTDLADIDTMTTSEINNLLSKKDYSTETYVDTKINNIEIPKETFTKANFKDFACWEARNKSKTVYNYSWKVKGVNITVNGNMEADEWTRYESITLKSDDGSEIDMRLTNTNDAVYLASDLEDINKAGIVFNDDGTAKDSGWEDTTELLDTEANIAKEGSKVAGFGIKYGGEEFHYPVDFEAGNMSTWANKTLYTPECVNIE